MSQSRQAKKLADYKAPSYAIDKIDIEFELDPLNTRVIAISQWRRLAENTDLVLDGQHLKLEAVWLNGVLLNKNQMSDDYTVSPSDLLAGKFLLVNKGKKGFNLVVVE